VNHLNAALHAASALWGRRLWAARPLAAAAAAAPARLSASLGLRRLSAALGGGPSLRAGFLGLEVAVCAWQAAGQLSRVARFDPARLPAAERGHKSIGGGAAARQLLLLAALLVLGAGWSAAPPCAAAPGACARASAASGLLYALVCTQLILAHMAKQPFRPSRQAYALLGLGAASAAAGADWSRALLPAAVLLYCVYVVGYVRQVSRHLNLRIFHLTLFAHHPAPAPAPAAAPQAPAAAAAGDS
jgi:hypothetical protein